VNSNITFSHVEKPELCDILTATHPTLVHLKYFDCSPIYKV